MLEMLYLVALAAISGFFASGKTVSRHRGGYGYKKKR